MKTIILAGGFGTRLSEYTNVIPKPMVPIGPKPILWHLMNLYASYSHTDFYVALGYKAEVIKDYFLNYKMLNSDFSVNLLNGDVDTYKNKELDWNVHLINTGSDSMTGGRVKRMQSYIGNEAFMLTYGDGVADINIDELMSFHKNHGKMVTMTAVRPAARFGELEIDNGTVSSFKEKPQLDAGWINGGFFVIEPEFFELIEGDHTLLEREPLEKAASIGELMAYKHYGFWQCMDTKRDMDHLNELWESNEAPWVLR
tara:strand:+ start:28298 stop:29065 length:768 start_codon:yes stop_codon:yes gene_type:complete